MWHLRLVIVISLIAVFHRQVGGLSCYFGTAEKTRDPNLPGDALPVECITDVAACYKQYMLSVTSDSSGRQIPKVELEWGCSDSLAPMNNYITCGSIYEYTWGGTVKGSLVSEYHRYCTCCGDLCNNDTMDAECNEVPEFTKQCFSAGDTKAVFDGKLPAETIRINCTANQSCFKQSVFDGNSSYSWGCLSSSMIQCGSTLNFSDIQDGYYKFCSCCGDLCNDASMDLIGAKDGSCQYAQLVPTFATTEETPPSTTIQLGQPDRHPAALTVAILLSSLLFVALVTVAVLSVVIHRLRQPESVSRFFKMNIDEDS